jgi:hypothetical protein
MGTVTMMWMMSIMTHTYAVNKPEFVNIRTHGCLPHAKYDKIMYVY